MAQSFNGIKTAMIPEFIREDLAAATFRSVREFLSSPEGQETTEVEKTAKNLTTSKK